MSEPGFGKPVSGRAMPADAAGSTAASVAEALATAMREVRRGLRIDDGPADWLTCLLQWRDL